MVMSREEQWAFFLVRCHSKISQTSWLKRQKFISSQFWGTEVQTQGALRVFVMESLFLACSQLPSGCVLTWPFLCACVWEREGRGGGERGEGWGREGEVKGEEGGGREGERDLWCLIKAAVLLD